MIVVGLTGNLASGKNEAAKVFKSLGARVLDADEAAKKLAKKGSPIFKAIVKLFGEDFVAKNGKLDRRKLAWHVFQHPADLKKLNTLIHPGVILEAYKAIESVKARKGMLVLNVPLLFEARMEKLVDVTVVVRSSDKQIFSRAAKRGVPKALTQKILASQWSGAKKAALADHVITNDGTLAELALKVKKVFGKIKTDLT